MCGIAGFINHKDDDMLKNMASLIAHRGPDEEGFYISENVSLASRRLKVIDLKGGSQPIFNEDKTICVVFNGEIYNFKEQKDFLEKKGHRFESNTDTEILVHLYEEYSFEMFKYLRGMFAFALYDAKKNIFILARDHFGIKPLFYSISKGKLFFASEIKSLIRSGAVEGVSDKIALDKYFTFLYVPQPDTIYQNIKKLPPAHFLVYKNKEIQIKRYWRLEKGRSISASQKDLAEQAFDLIKKSVKEQIVSDVPLGLFLSGGIDSSSIAAALSELRVKDVKTLTIAYENEKKYDESGPAFQVADFLGLKNKKLNVSFDLVNDIEFLAENFDQPFADSSSIITYLISKEARKDITVALTGIGGDELFAGYPRHLALRFFSSYGRLPISLRKFVFSLFSQMKEKNDSFNMPGRMKRFFSAGASCENSFCAYKDWISYLKPDFRKNFYHKDFYFDIKKSDEKPDFPRDLLEFEIENYLEGDLLYLADMASMLNSLEIRVPFLDLRLVEFANEIPLSLKTKNFSGKSILRKMLQLKLPENILSAPKKGFQVPLPLWLGGPLKEFAFDIINSSDGTCFDKDNAIKLLNAHINREKDNSDLIYAVLIFELWRKSAGKKNTNML